MAIRKISEKNKGLKTKTVQKTNSSVKSVKVEKAKKSDDLIKEPVKTRKKKKSFLYVKGLCDAGIVHDVYEITDEQLDEFRPLIKAIKKKGKGKNWDKLYPEMMYSDISEKVIDDFSAFVPNGKDCIVNTIGANIGNGIQETMVDELTEIWAFSGNGEKLL